MATNRKLVVRTTDLPMIVELIDGSERIIYQLMPAGRKPGAFLQKADNSLATALRDAARS